jgi:hypothetical protein
MEAPRALGAFPYRRVVIVCPWCPRRRGSYDTERLIARLGPGASLEDVLAALVRCRWPAPWHVRRPGEIFGDCVVCKPAAGSATRARIHCDL